jgi:WD40 repeat protein
MAETTQGANGSGSVFISYSRKDKAFVQKLNDALDAAGVQAWVDREGIELASDWMERITSSIQGTDAFLWDMATAQEMARIPHDNPVTSVSFSPDGAQLLTVSRKVARIWDISAIHWCQTMDLFSTPAHIS